jgi:peptide/nickel transport system ATP-binding protein
MLSIEGLSIDYQVGRRRLSILQNAALEFPQGQVTALIGESGSGKTTLTGAILGLLASNAVVLSGRILWNGTNLLEQDPEALRRFRWRHASVVFQAAQGAWNPTLTIGRQMLDCCTDHGVSDGRGRMDRLFKQVRLDPARIAAAYPHQLSGGMRQRALIAMSLMLDPELLILDEPTTALDLITQSYIFDILADIHKATGLTMVLVTHDLAAVARLADRVAVLYAGTVCEVAAADTLFESPSHPYSRILLSSTPDVHGSMPDTLAGEGKPPDLRQRPDGCIFASRCPERVEVCTVSVPTLGEEKVACHRRKS